MLIGEISWKIQYFPSSAVLPGEGRILQLNFLLTVKIRSFEWFICVRKSIITPVSNRVYGLLVLVSDKM